MELNRSQRREMAAETVQVIEQGWYEVEGTTVELSQEIERMKAGSRLVDIDDWPQIESEAKRVADSSDVATVFELENETTLAGCRRLLAHGHVWALNFASAKNPGGGFRNGAEAQEESLARSSGLIESLELFMDSFYEPHRKLVGGLYTDRMIVSPDTPVFRDDHGTLLETPYPVTFVTSPAVNAGAVESNVPEKSDQILPLMRQRASRLLALAAASGARQLVLGAWGCGVFRNDPRDIAAVFGELLLNDGAFANTFERVAFSVLDRSSDQCFQAAFRETFISR